MKIMSMRERLLASSMICGAALLSLTAGSAHAQAAPGAEVQEIVVTGTRIPTPNLTSVSPVTSIGNAEIKSQGVTRVEDIVNSLPQAFAAQGSSYSNGSNGTATVNLRGLGAARTLVLIDGRRLMGGNPTSAIAPIAADLNFIPSSLVQRVDVLTGGASAVYGADAVAGVVNFIMLKDFEGVRLDAQYSIYQHTNDSDTQAIVKAKQATASVPSQYALPDKNVRDGEGSQVSITMGVNAPDGQGNITAYASYLHYEPIFQANRDFSACTFNSGAAFTCGGSGTAFPARVGAYLVDPAGPGNTFRLRNATNDVYNFGPVNYFQRPDDRYSMGAFAHYEIAPWAVAYADLMYMQDGSTYQIAPGGVFASSGPVPGGLFNINCNNPLLTPTQQTQLCGAQAGTAALLPFNVARRNIEGGGRQGRFDHQAQRYVIGLRGDINDDWSYDAFLQYGATSLTQVQRGYFLTSRIQNALLATTNAQGQIVCQSVVSGADTACVPYNIFSLGGVTQAALNYLTVPAYSTGHINERVADISLTGMLPEGMQSPMAKDRIGVSVGAEYRREHLDFSADFPQSAGLLNGAGGASPPVDGGFDVYELFSEARVPLVQDAPFVENLQLELAYRFSDYSSVSTTNTYKIAGDWTIVGGWRVRAGYNRAVRAPNVVELFAPPNVVLNGTIDPCAGLAATDPLVQRCATLFGLTPAQVLAIEPDPASQYNGQTSGNPNLAPETADTWSVGLVAQPRFMPGLNVSLDAFDIKVKDYISTLGQDRTLQTCIDTGNPVYCGLIHRDALGGIKSPQGFVVDALVNTGSLHTRGLDVAVNYRTDLESLGLADMGGLSVNFQGTWLDLLEIEPLPGDEPIDCAGLYGTLCSTGLGGSTAPNPEWRHKLRVTWNTPFQAGPWLNDLSLSAQWRYVGKVTLDTLSPQQGLSGGTPSGPASDAKFPSMNYLDLTANWAMHDRYSFRVGVNNVLDKDPPLSGQTTCPSGPCSGNTWGQTYDALGRYLFVGFTAEF